MNEKKRILVIDDEPSITRLLKINLEQTENYIVEVENDATNAVAKAMAFQPDLILLDVLMPGVDGGALAARFQASSRLAKVPVVFLTAAATKREVNTHQGRIGGLPFLAKPVDMPEVLATLQERLG